jgi:alkylation response protein AidB-like acyl-CoA dehydrogenase
MTRTVHPPTDLTLTQFTDAAEAFLSRVAEPRRSADRTSRRETSLFRASTVAEAEAAREWQRTVFDAGFGWITGPREYGGRGLPRTYERAYLALERQYDVPSRAALGVSLGMVAPTLLDFGTPEALQEWARALHRGDAIGCQLFSEPGAGSDLAAVGTRAQRRGSEWFVSGQKVWTSGAHYSDIGLLLARTSSQPRHRNLTAFIVDMHASGVEVRPLRQMTGGADFNEVFLTDVRVPDAHRLGEVDHGWGVALTTLLYERGAIGGAGAGGTGLFDMDSLAGWLRQSGRSADPLVRQAYAKVRAGVDAAKAMRRRAEAAAGAGSAPGPEMSLAKLALVSNLDAMAEVITLALGPELVVDTGRPETFGWTEFVLGVPGMRLGGGTDEVQKNIIAKRVLRLPDEPRPTT